MTQKRALGLGETYVKFCYDHANGTTHVVAMVRVAGPLTADLVKRGLALLQMRHPLLRASFVTDAQHDYFVVDDKPAIVPLNIIPRTSIEQWQRVYEQHLNQPSANGRGYLWQATFLQGESYKSAEHEIVASFHHTIIDGISLGYFFRDLLNYCSSLAEDKAPLVEPLPFLPNVENLQKRTVSWSDYLTRGEIGAKQLLKMEKHLFPYETDVPLNQRKTRAIYFDAGEEELKRMVTMCRENKTTLTALLSAALLIAAYRARNEQNSGNKYFRLKQTSMTPVDMRKRCNLVSDNDNIGCFVCAATTMNTVDGHTALWPLARSFRKKLSKAVEEQADSPAEFDRQLDIQILSGIKAGALEKKFHLGVGVTNYGILDLPVSGGQFNFREFYSGAARHWGDWLMLLHTATVGNRLSACFCYEEPLMSEGTAKKLVKEFISLLHSAVSP